MNTSSSSSSRRSRSISYDLITELVNCQILAPLPPGGERFSFGSFGFDVVGFLRFSLTSWRSGFFLNFCRVRGFRMNTGRLLRGSGATLEGQRGTSSCTAGAGRWTGAIP